MELFRWSNEYSVNSEELDKQHKKLFEITNRLYDAFSANEHREKLGELISELHDYTVYHFSEEEKLIRNSVAPLTPEHLAEHEEFTQKVADFRSKFEQGRAAVTYELMGFLRQWLKNHILVTDKEYAKHSIQ